MSEFTSERTLVERIAEIMHNELCERNHIDYCDWFYDKGNWTSYARKQYLKTAKEIVKIVQSKGK